MLKLQWVWWLAAALAARATLAAEPVRVVPGPQEMPRVSVEMLTAEYWTDRLAEPDTILVTPDQARKHVRTWQEAGLLIDIFSLPNPLPKATLREWLRSDLSYLRRVGRYGENGRPLIEDDYQRIISNLDLSRVPRNTSPAYGLAVRRTALRLFPTELVATSKPLDLEFNQLVHSALRLAEPVAILHTSQDGEWWYVASEIGRGWVRAIDIARAKDQETVRDYKRLARIKIVDRSAQLLLEMDPDNAIALPETLEMGCELVPFSIGPEVLVPRREDDGTLALEHYKVQPASAAVIDGLPCTRRNLLMLAFRLLDAPYGWGGEGGFGDCSEIIRRMGLACGLRLPRSTSDLARALAGEDLPAGPQARRRRLAGTRGGADLIVLPGHVMLVLGTVEDRLFVVHNLYGIQARDDQGDFIRRVGRVVVSDLSLGVGSRKGSLEQRSQRVLFLDRPAGAAREP